MAEAKLQKMEQLGNGGFGTVYRAVIPGGMEYAWKEANSNVKGDNLRRFKREVRIQSQLTHDHIMPILAFDVERTPPVFIMPRASHTLESVIQEIASDQEQVVDIFLKVCSAISHAHKQGILHRDLKPSNILFLNDEPVVADFGLCCELDRQTATITQTNMQLGTFAYMSPEQMRDAKHVDARSDIYTLGKILYQMLTGDLPFPTIDTSRLPDGFRYIVDKATSTRPSDRFFSVDELSNEVELLTRRKESLLPIQQSAQELISRAASTGDVTSVCKAISFLLRHAQSSQLHQEVVARLPKRVIDIASKHCNDDLCEVMEALCTHVSGQLTFAFVDVVAETLKSAFYACAKSSTKKIIVKRLIQMGHSHNRYHVRDVVQEISENLPTNDEILIFRDAANECKDCLSWYQAIFSTRTPEIIRETFTQTESTSQECDF